MVRVRSDLGLILGYGLIPHLMRGEIIAQVEMGAGAEWIYLQGLSDQLQGPFHISILVVQRG